MKPATRTQSIRITAVSLAAAGAIFGGLAVQMAHGHDPALGGGTRTSSSSSAGQDEFSQQNQSGGSPSGVVTRAS